MTWLPSSLANAVSRTGGLFFDALKDGGSRRSLPSSRFRQADRKFANSDRRTLDVKLQTAVDNFSLAVWMVRVHLNHVAEMQFKANTGNKGVDDQLDKFVLDWSSRFNCHAQRTRSLPELIRAIEYTRVCYGDVFVIKIGGTGPQRGSLQIIEPDRVDESTLPQQSTSTFSDTSTSRVDDWPWFGGIKVSPTGIPSAICVNRRSREGDIVYERTVSAQNYVQFSYSDRVDQYRGVSPLVAGINSLEDIYEGYTYALKKLKVAQALAAVITRDANIGLGAYPETDGNGDGIPDRDFAWDMSDGPKIFDLNPGEGVSVIQGTGDNLDAITLIKAMTQVTLKCMDIPMSYYSEDFSNWFGNRASRMHFEKAARPKQRTLMCGLNEILRWRFGMAVADGEIELPASMEFEDLSWEWVPETFGWFDPLKEAQGMRAMVSAGFDSPVDIAKASGRDWRKIIDDRAMVEEYARNLGVNLDYSMGSSSSAAVEQPQAEVEDEDPNDEMPTDETPDEESDDQPTEEDEDDE